jgi:hypothetical protein
MQQKKNEGIQSLFTVATGRVYGRIGGGFAKSSCRCSNPLKILCNFFKGALKLFSVFDSQLQTCVAASQTCVCKNKLDLCVGNSASV